MFGLPYISFVYKTAKQQKLKNINNAIQINKIEIIATSSLNLISN